MEILNYDDTKFDYIFIYSVYKSEITVKPPTVKKGLSVKTIMTKRHKNIYALINKFELMILLCVTLTVWVLTHSTVTPFNLST